MNIISKNVKGLDNHKKNTSIKDIIRKTGLEIVLIQETKKPTIDKKGLSSFWGSRNEEWVVSQLDGLAEC